MDHATTTISKIFSGETRFYTRFNADSNGESESTQVEIKNSSDGEDDVGDSVGEHHVRDTYRPRQQSSSRSVAFMILGTLLIFVIGYLLGYVSNRRPVVQPEGITPEPTGDSEDTAKIQTEYEPPLDWNDIQKLLREKLLSDQFNMCFRNFTLSSHEAGSDGEKELGTKIFDMFAGLDMSPWTDVHYVKLQNPNGSLPNKVLFGTTVIGTPVGYLAYSAKGTVEGKVIYTHYGQQSDFDFLFDMNFNFSGAVVLVRAGKISFAEKVANAAKVGAAAVLIYPDPVDMTCSRSCNLYGHVHLGSGDPFTPGFPSFNHTQFPPAQSSGLPNIVAQTITPDMAASLFQKMGGVDAPRSWVETRLKDVHTLKLGTDSNKVTVEVNNVLVDKEIHNVFGVIKGFVDPDRYVVIGAQRDSWGYGYAKSTVGTCVLMQLAQAITDMVKNGGFRPRRSIVFASWSAGEYGNVGLTEWLEGYLSSLNMKAFTYISLDGVVTGSQGFKAAASPMLYKLIVETLKEVKGPGKTNQKTLYDQFAPADWQKSIMVPMKMDDSAYPFLAFSGIPSVSFRFTSLSANDDYQYFGTLLDDKDHLDYVTQQTTADMAVTAAQVAGNMLLRLVHDHLLRLDVDQYRLTLRRHVSSVVQQVSQQMKPVNGTKTKVLNTQWLMSAYGSYSRAAQALVSHIQNSELNDIETCRIINDRIMRVESNFLSPYMSPKDTPFRHIFFGSGSHTLQALKDHIVAIRKEVQGSDMNMFQNQFALATWTIQGCANNLAGNVWELDNQI